MTTQQGTTEVGFMGAVQPAQCDCHKGQFFALVFLLHPVLGRVPVANEPFPTEAIATERLDGFVKEIAFQTIEAMGLDPKAAVKIEVTHDDEATKSEARVMKKHNATNPNLH